jgi:hypothetical protein
MARVAGERKFVEHIEKTSRESAKTLRMNGSHGRETTLNESFPGLTNSKRHINSNSGFFSSLSAGHDLRILPVELLLEIIQFAIPESCPAESGLTAD